VVPTYFQTVYMPEADAVSHGTGIDPYVLLAQWGRETGWGSVVNNQNNLANIRCPSHPGGPYDSFCQYPTLGDFALACIATWHNGYYAAVLAAVGAETQMAAICASPWDSGHYGGSLQPDYDLLEVSLMSDAQYTSLQATLGNVRATQAAQSVTLAAVAAAIAHITIAAGGLNQAQAAELDEAAAELKRIEAALKGA